MQKRINFFEKAGKAMNVLGGFSTYLPGSLIDQHLRYLVITRVSIINGCSFCLDMHSKDMLEMGETIQRTVLLGAWREATVYTERERAALAWAEAVTEIAGKGVSDEVYAEATTLFTDEELIDLTMAVIAINCYNRLNVAFQTPAGSYVPGQFAKVHA